MVATVKALVTGAAGFVGSQLVRTLLARGVQVRALVRSGSTGEALAGLDVEVVQGDVRDATAASDALQGCDTLFHVAAFYSTREADAPLLYEINVKGTLTVMLAALRRGITKVVLTSTIGTIGQSSDGTPADESLPFNMWATASHYARSKHLGDLAALAVAEEGLPLVIVHPTGCVGGGDRKPSATGQRIVNALRGRRDPYPPGGINFVAVSDVAEGHLLAAERGQVRRRYILGNRAGNLTEEAFHGLVSRVSGSPVPKERAQGRRSRLLRIGPARASKVGGHLPHALTADPTRAIVELGLPQTPLESAFSEAVAWFRARSMV